MLGTNGILPTVAPRVATARFDATDLDRDPFDGRHCRPMSLLTRYVLIELAKVFLVVLIALTGLLIVVMVALVRDILLPAP